jgi:hypothetical protein
MMAASAAACMTGAGLCCRKLGKLAALNHFDVLPHRSLHGPENTQSFRLELHQGTHADSTRGNAIHLASAKGLDRLAHTVCMVLIAVLNFFDAKGFRIDNDKARGGAKVTENDAVQALQIFRGKTDLHNLNLQCVSD